MHDMARVNEDKIVKPAISGPGSLAGGVFLAFLLTACVVDKTLWRGVTTAKYFYFTGMLCLAKTFFQFSNPFGDFT